MVSASGLLLICVDLIGKLRVDHSPLGRHSFTVINLYLVWLIYSGSELGQTEVAHIKLSNGHLNLE